MSKTRENISLWLDQSEPDYYLFFLKSWIPFNAWYVAEYPHLNKKDTDLIKELQDNPDSKPKKIIKNFLKNKKDHDSLKFQSYLAELHYSLEKTPLSHNGEILSFKELPLTENPIKHKNDKDVKGNVYKTEKTKSFFQAYIEAKGGKVLLDFKKPLYNLEELTKDTDYIRLDKKIQKIIYKLFDAIDPKKPISIISSSSISGEYRVVKSEHSCKIISDTDTVAKACIKILYNLRCMLFHGEVAPNETNKPVFENAFYLLQLINKHFK